VKIPCIKASELVVDSGAQASKGTIGFTSIISTRQRTIVGRDSFRLRDVNQSSLGYFLESDYLDNSLNAPETAT
jgi:hypothetical protein